MNSTQRTEHRTQPFTPDARPVRSALARFANWIDARLGEHDEQLQALRVYSRERVDSRHSR